MDRLVSLLLLVLIAAVLGVGLVTYRADQAAREDRQELTCIQRAQATATVALLTPASRVDEDGRVAAARALGDTIDGC